MQPAKVIERGQRSHVQRQATQHGLCGQLGPSAACRRTPARVRAAAGGGRREHFKPCCARLRLSRCICLPPGANCS